MTEPDDAAAEVLDAEATSHDDVIKAVDAVISAQMPTRVLSLQARRFVAIPGAQWEGPWGEQFDHSIKVEINKTARGLRKIKLDYLANRIIPTFRNVGSDADEHTASTLAGIYRADFHEYKAQQAIDNAFSEASAGGFGAYRLATVMADPYDLDSDDKRINPAMLIADADMRVFFDPDSQLMDKSDARWVCVLVARSRDAFKRAYPDAATSSMSTIWKPHYEWFRPDQVVIAEYYEKREATEKLWFYKNKITNAEQRWWNSEIDEDERKSLRDTGFTETSKMRKRVRVYKRIMSGAEWLSKDMMIAGTELPVIPMYGNRDYIDGVERFTGHVQMAMDPQRVYNAQVSMVSEHAALSPREIPIFDPEQMPPNLQDLWARMNIDKHPYALAKALRDENGNVVQAGPTGKIEPAQMSPVTGALIQLTGADIAELTNADDGADEVRSNTSAEAMDIAATRIDAKSGVYIDNAKQSVQRGGEVYLSMARDGVYCRAGREVETMDNDDQDGMETLLQPFTDGPDGAYGIRNDISKGKYKVIADVTEATSTLRDRTVRRMLNVAQVATGAQDVEMAAAALRTAVANMDGEGLDDFKAWNRKAMLQIGLAEPTDKEKREAEAAAQQNPPQPDPQAQALQAQAAALEADAALKQAQEAKAKADTEQSQAKTVLTLAQAHALGGPEKAPDVPSGLNAGPTPIDVSAHIADVSQKHADTMKMHAETRAIHHAIDHPEGQNNG